MPTNQFVISNPKASITKLPEQGMKKNDFIDDFKQYYVHLLGRDENCHSPYYAGQALSQAIRDRLMQRWKATHQVYKLTLLFLPDYRVLAMEKICPGADLSEQISIAGKEASGTGNMKLMMNGAITIRTLDGANIEIREEVGDENFFLFGLTEQQVEERRGHYDPLGIISQDKELQEVMHLLEAGCFNQFEPGLFDDLINSIKSAYDPWMSNIK
jgi:glucan phosphorylase